MNTNPTNPREDRRRPQDTVNVSRLLAGGNCYACAARPRQAVITIELGRGIRFRLCEACARTLRVDIQRTLQRLPGVGREEARR